MGIQPPRFFDAIILSAAYSKIEGKEKKNLKDFSIRQKMTNFVDKILAKFSSSYANRRTELNFHVMREHANKYFRVDQITNKILVPSSQKESQIKESKEGSGLENLFENKIEKEPFPIAQQTLTVDQAIESLEKEGLLPNEKKEYQSQLEKDSVSIKNEKRGEGENPQLKIEDEEVKEKTVLKDCAPLAAKPLDPIVIDIPEEELTEKDIDDIMQAIWNFDQEKLDEADRNKMKQFAQYVQQNMGAYAAMMGGIQMKLATIIQLLLGPSKSEKEASSGFQCLDSEGEEMKALFNLNDESLPIEELKIVEKKLEETLSCFQKELDPDEEKRENLVNLKNDTLNEPNQEQVAVWNKAQNFLQSLTNNLGVYLGFISVAQAEAKLEKLPKSERESGNGSA